MWLQLSIRLRVARSTSGGCSGRHLTSCSTASRSRRWVACRARFFADSAESTTPSSSATSARLKLHPPGMGAEPAKVEKFMNHVDRSLSVFGEELEFNARGPISVRHVLHALAKCRQASVFEVEWAGTGGRGDGGDRSLRFLAKRSGTWQDFMQNRQSNTPGFPVHGSTKVLQLARAVAIEERKIGAMRVHTHIDDESAVNIMAKALATAPSVNSHLGFRRLFCTPNMVKFGDRSRVFVYVRGEPAEVDLPGPSGATFTAMPPGAEPDSDTIHRFVRTVHDRLCRGDTVEAQCRGPDAVGHTMRALCLLQGYTAEFEVRWVQHPSTQDKSSDVQLNVLAVSAWRGETWDDFNRTDFSKSELLFAKASTNVQQLAWALTKEVRQKGRVALHCYSDNKDAVNVSVKALATIPFMTDGERVMCIPSLGRAGERRNPTLRLSIKRLPKS